MNDESVRRLPAILGILVLVGAVVAGGIVLDRRVPLGAPAAAAVAPADLAPLTAPEGVAGATWYCAAGTAVDDGIADHDVVIANVGDAGATATVTVFDGAPSDDPAARGVVEGSEPVVESLDLPARSRVVVTLADLVEAPFASALVEVAGAGSDVVVEHVIRGEDDLGTAPCASRAATSWHVAAGDTTLGAEELLVLFNPFPDDAVVDVRFATPEGNRTPPEFTAFVVPARTTSVIDVGVVVSRHAQVSTTVEARAGRLVVERIQRFTDDLPGLDLTPAAPAPALVWHFPEGLASQSADEVVTVYNPGEVPAEVDVELVLAPSDDPAVVTAVEPVALSVPAGGFGQVDLGADERLPDGLSHSITVRSLNGQGVVAERWQRNAGDGRSGLTTTLGSPVVATRWSTAIGGVPADGSQAEFLVVQNPSATDDATFTVSFATDLSQVVPEELRDVALPAGERLVLDMGGALPDTEELLVVVTSTSPIVVERGLYLAAGGYAQSLAIAGADGVEVAPVDTGAVTLGGDDPVGGTGTEPTQVVPGAETTTTTAPSTTTTTGASTTTAPPTTATTAPA